MGWSGRGSHRGRLALWVALASSLLIAAAHAEQRGKVYFLVNRDAPRAEWERRPLPGAFVVLRWTVVIPAPGHAVDSCRYAELARTDEAGEYVMEGPNPITASLADASYFVYSPGVEPIAFPYGGSPMSPRDITMALSTRTPEERLSNISYYTAPGCWDKKLGDPRALLLPYLRAVLDEAKTLKVDSPRGQADLAHIEAVLRTASGLDRPQPLRVAPAPAQGAIEAVRASPPSPAR